MKLEKAPQETYADIGGLETQIQEIKESVELPLTHPEYYEEMGIKPPKGIQIQGFPSQHNYNTFAALAGQRFKSTHLSVNLLQEQLRVLRYFLCGHFCLSLL